MFAASSQVATVCSQLFPSGRWLSASADNTTPGLWPGVFSF